MNRNILFIVHKTTRSDHTGDNVVHVREFLHHLVRDAPVPFADIVQFCLEFNLYVRMSGELVQTEGKRWRRRLVAGEKESHDLTQQVG